MQNTRSIGGQGQVSWVAACCDQVTEDGGIVTRFFIQTKLSPQDRKWVNQAAVARMQKESPTDIAAKISAEVDATEASRVRVVAMFATGKIPCSQRIWETPLAEDEDEDGSGLGGTAHDAMAVVVGQTLRHNEVMMARMVTMGDQQIRTLTAQNSMLSQQQSQLLADRLELADAQRKLIIETAQTEAENERSSALVDGMKLLMQTVAYKVTGGNVAGDSKYKVLNQILTTIGETISDEQAAALSKILDPKQMMALSSILEDPAGKVEQIEEHRAKKGTGDA